VAKVELLDNDELIKKIDRSGMLAVVAAWPEQLQQAAKYAAGVALSRPDKVSQVIVCGMGGSAIAGDIAADLFFKRCKVPLTTNRHYSLPNYAGPDSVVFALSYSGETEETLSAVKEAEAKGAKMICITSGGKLREIAENKKYPLFLVPAGYQPRAALPFLLVALLSGLEKLGLVPPQADELKEAITLTQTLRDEYGPGRPARLNAAKQLAKKLLGKIPFIFGATGTTAAVALRCKCQLNENSKMTAIANVFPELNHNEIVAIAQLKKEGHNFGLVVLRDDDDNERIKKRIEITKSLISRQIGGVSEFSSRGRSRLARALSLIFLGDLVSVYLALISEVDPTPVEIIGRLKKEMQR
jgi:glucose/mannose-6-phosphate isomerase